MSAVLQDWVTKLPWKMQSVLISGMRGPDTANQPELKSLTKWIRKQCQNDAEPNVGYMDIKKLPALSMLEKPIEFCTVHFVAHLLYALEIIAYKHPSRIIRDVAYKYYQGILVGDILHFGMETEQELDERLKDCI